MLTSSRGYPDLESGRRAWGVPGKATPSDRDSGGQPSELQVQDLRPGPPVGALSWGLRKPPLPFLVAYCSGPPSLTPTSCSSANLLSCPSSQNHRENNNDILVTIMILLVLLVWEAVLLMQIMMLTLTALPQVADEQTGLEDQKRPQSQWWNLSRIPPSVSS